MSKHSKNCTSSSVFTYMQRQKLKGIYGTNETRIGQDSIKTFQMCTICNNRLIQPTSCDNGHLFCRNCAIEYLVKQKKKISEYEQSIQKRQTQKIVQQREKQIQKQLNKLQKFEKYQNFTQITNRHQLNQGEKVKVIETKQISQKDVKPIGIYELNVQKVNYVKSAFWSLQNAPVHVQKIQIQSKKVICPGGNHTLTMKKLRKACLKEIDNEFLCWICSKQIKRQKIGMYKCGHIVCVSCKSDKCQICNDKQSWIQVENGHSSFAAHNKAEVKTYSYSFVC